MKHANQLEQMKKEVNIHLPEYTVLLNAYLDKAYQAGQEAERERFTKILQQSYISEESVICICNKEVERIINLINSKE